MAETNIAPAARRAICHQPVWNQPKTMAKTTNPIVDPLYHQTAFSSGPGPGLVEPLGICATVRRRSVSKLAELPFAMKIVCLCSPFQNYIIRPGRLGENGGKLRQCPVPGAGCLVKHHPYKNSNHISLSWFFRFDHPASLGTGHRALELTNFLACKNSVTNNIRI